jgi:CBS domain-containing protein
MTAGVSVVRPDVSLVEAARLMRALDIGDVLVADGDRLIEVVTDRDITTRAIADGRAPLTVSAASVYTPTPVCVGPDDEGEDAIRLMASHAVRRLPVVEDGRPLEVVSIGDLAITQDASSALAGITPQSGTANRAEHPCDQAKGQA